MSAYRVVWTVVVAVLGGLGAVVALVSTEGGIVFSIVALSGVIMAVIHYSLGQDAVHWAPKEDLPTFIAVGAVGGVAMAGYVELLGAIWVPGAVLLLALSPALLTRLTPLFRCLPAIAGYLTDPPRPDPEWASADVGPCTAQPAPASRPFTTAASEMTTAQLCSAWRASFVALGGLRDSDPTTRALLVSSRQQYLDELETRDPAGFSRWLAAGAGPGSDPSRYLRSAEVPRPRT